MKSLILFLCLSILIFFWGGGGAWKYMKGVSNIKKIHNWTLEKLIKDSFENLIFIYLIKRPKKHV
jgi:hypothetical protein